jgi:hypothetical protein
MASRSRVSHGVSTLRRHRCGCRMALRQPQRLRRHRPSPADPHRRGEAHRRRTAGARRARWPDREAPLRRRRRGRNQARRHRRGRCAALTTPPRGRRRARGPSARHADPGGPPTTQPSRGGDHHLLAEILTASERCPRQRPELPASQPCKNRISDNCPAPTQIGVDNDGRHTHPEQHKPAGQDGAHVASTRTRPVLAARRPHLRCTAAVAVGCVVAARPAGERRTVLPERSSPPVTAYPLDGIQVSRTSSL